MSDIRQRIIEEVIVYDILGNGILTEVDFQRILDKVKSYATKGLMTAAILASLMNNSAFSEVQKDAINNAAQTEMSYEVGGDEITAKELNKMLKNGGYHGINVVTMNTMIKSGMSFKIFHGKANIQVGAENLAKSKAEKDGTQDRQSQLGSRKVGNKYEAILIVPIR
jgi:hypothetical protein